VDGDAGQAKCLPGAVRRDGGNLKGSCGAQTDTVAKRKSVAPCELGKVGASQSMIEVPGKCFEVKLSEEVAGLRR